MTTPYTTPTHLAQHAPFPFPYWPLSKTLMDPIYPVFLVYITLLHIPYTRLKRASALRFIYHHNGYVHLVDS